MTPSLNHLKEQIISLKKQRGTRAKLPPTIWEGILKISDDYSIVELSKQLNLNPTYMRQKLKSMGKVTQAMKKTTKPSGVTPDGFVQVATSSVRPVLELELKSGSIIRIFES